MSKADANESDGDKAVEKGHLDDVADGCGCVEIWEDLSEYREQSE